MNKFEVGTRVGFTTEEKYNTDEDISQRGEVVSFNTKNGFPFVKWDDYWPNSGKPEEMNPDSLLLESELDTQMSKLEAEYQAAVDPIQKKVKKAAALLVEAAEMADAVGYELSNMSDVVSPMLGAMRSAGWRTSALHC